MSTIALVILVAVLALGSLCEARLNTGNAGDRGRDGNVGGWR
jgi:hypothetical protein